MCEVEHSKHSFHNLDSYIALQRLNGLRLSPDGSRLITTVAALNEEGTKYLNSLWELDPAGRQSARRLTHGEQGESQPRFNAEGDLLFVAKRSEKEDATAGVWLLPRNGGEAQLLAAHPAGIDTFTTLPHAPAGRRENLVITAHSLPGARDIEEEKALRELRKDKKVDAILHTGYPVRYWDTDLGPQRPNYYTASVSQDPATPAELHNITPGAGGHLLEAGMDVAPNGQFLLTDWSLPEGRGSIHTGIMRIDLETGQRELLLSPDERYEYEMGRISPDSTQLIYTRAERSTPQRPVHPTLWLMNLDSGESHQVAVGWDRWASSITWLPNGTGVLLTADDTGRAPVFHLALESDKVTRLTTEGAYSDVAISPDSRSAYALRASYEYPAEPVKLDLAHISALEEGEQVQLQELDSPVQRPQLPGTLQEVDTTAADGTSIRAWLAVPHEAGAQNPAPLLLWVHGGPLSSWNSWSWRWNPWLLVAQGYAVLLPDPGLSTGYGQEFIARGWGTWGEHPYTDLMAITDAAEQRPDIDASRTAAMGGSFGGYMANWIAGQTQRFKAIVTHASLWDLDGFGPTTDAAFYWAREMQPEMVTKYSPSRYVKQIRTPMLVIHGDKDYRVPIGEGLRLWYELLSLSGLPQQADGSTAHRFLYFPQENHWILSPQHAKLWYQVVIGYLAEHVLEHEPQPLPEVLGLRPPQNPEPQQD